MSQLITEHPDIKYLKGDPIGPILSKGLAVLYREQPQFPIEYLAKWLLNYSCSVQNEKNYAKVLEHKAELIEKSIRQKADDDKFNQGIELKRQNQIDHVSSNIKRIETYEYLNELLVKEFPDFLCNRRTLSGVYVGILDFPTKEIDEMDEDENAHLDQTQPKQITFIGASQGHNFMIGQHLLLEQGVTGEVFKPPQEVDGEMKPPAEYLYVNNVVKEPRLIFFRIPKLGAFMAMPLIWNSSLSEAAFDIGTEERIRFRKAKAEQEKEKEARETKFQDDLREKQEANESTEELENEYDTWKKAFEDIQEAPFQTIKKEYAVSLDTLGLDKEISVKDQEYLNGFVKLFAKSWENTEREQLSNDINFQIEYLEGLGQNPPKELAENFNNEEEKYAEDRRNELDEYKDKEKEMNYQLECFRLEKLNQILATKEVQDWVFHLKKYHVVKYLAVFQAIWYLLGKKKEEVNKPGTTVVFWKNASWNVNEDFFKQVLSYDHRGAKPEEVKKYAKIAHLVKKIEKINPEDIDNYNLGLGRLFRWLAMTLKLRRLNIEIRKENCEKKINERFEKMDLNEKLKANKELAIEEQKNSIPPEELEAFDFAEWEKNYDEEHPLAEIPEEVVEEVDNDLDNE